LLTSGLKRWFRETVSPSPEHSLSELALKLDVILLLFLGLFPKTLSIVGIATL
jgi:hypothetical protein